MTRFRIGWFRSYFTSKKCDHGDHDTCDGTVNVFDTPDGPNRYECGCHCHRRESS